VGGALCALSDQPHHGRRWDSTSHIQQGIFEENNR